jgi:hypothetical protein
LRDQPLLRGLIFIVAILLIAAFYSHVRALIVDPTRASLRAAPQAASQTITLDPQTIAQSSGNLWVCGKISNGAGTTDDPPRLEIQALTFCSQDSAHRNGPDAPTPVGEYCTPTSSEVSVEPYVNRQPQRIVHAHACEEFRFPVILQSGKNEIYATFTETVGWRQLYDRTPVLRVSTSSHVTIPVLDHQPPITADSQILVSGHGAPGDWIRIRLIPTRNSATTRPARESRPITVFAPTLVDMGGRFSYPLDVASAGTYEIIATEINGAGAVNSAPIKITYDPFAPILSPIESSVTIGIRFKSITTDVAVTLPRDDPRLEALMHRNWPFSQFLLSTTDDYYVDRSISVRGALQGAIPSISVARSGWATVEATRTTYAGTQTGALLPTLAGNLRIEAASMGSTERRRESLTLIVSDYDVRAVTPEPTTTNGAGDMTWYRNALEDSGGFLQETPTTIVASLVFYPVDSPGNITKMLRLSPLDLSPAPLIRWFPGAPSEYQVDARYWFLNRLSLWLVFNVGTGLLLAIPMFYFIVVVRREAQQDTVVSPEEKVAYFGVVVALFAGLSLLISELWSDSSLSLGVSREPHYGYVFGAFITALALGGLGWAWASRASGIPSRLAALLLSAAGVSSAAVIGLLWLAGVVGNYETAPFTFMRPFDTSTFRLGAALALIVAPVLAFLISRFLEVRTRAAFAVLLLVCVVLAVPSLVPHSSIILGTKAATVSSPVYMVEAHARSKSSDAQSRTSATLRRVNARAAALAFFSTVAPTAPYLFGASLILMLRRHRQHLSRDFNIAIAALLFSCYAVGTTDNVFLIPVSFLLSLLVFRRFVLSGGPRCEMISGSTPDIYRKREQLVLQALGQGKHSDAPASSTHLPPMECALAVGPMETDWDNAVLAMKIGLVFGAIYAALYAPYTLAQLADAQPKYPMLSLLAWLTSSIGDQVIPAFLFGYAFRWIAHDSGVQKGLRLSAATIVCLLPMWIIEFGADSPWAVIVTSVQIFILYATIGVTFDYLTLKAALKSKFQWQYVAQLGDMPSLASFGAVIVANVAIGVAALFNNQLVQGVLPAIARAAAPHSPLTP